MSSSRYWELTVAIPPEASEGLTNFVWELGALGVIEEEARERASSLRAFFPGTKVASVLEERVCEYLRGLAELGFARAGGPTVVALADEDWANAWRAHFRPLEVGRGLLVAPPWERPPADGRLVITIDPGRAFGTGQHGSTLGCLETLEALVVPSPPARLLDLGTGSGILAIAAARLGVPYVFAVDDDPDAVASATANVERNGVRDRVRCVLADAAALAEAPAPLVVANLLTSAHRRLARHYARCVTAGGALVLGGVLDAEAPSVAAAAAAHGFTPCARVSIDGWTTLHLRREPGELAQAALRGRA